MDRKIRILPPQLILEKCIGKQWKARTYGLSRCERYSVHIQESSASALTAHDHT
jgi:hypothetical protein